MNARTPRTPRTVLIGLAAGLSAAAGSTAQVLYTTFGPGDSYSLGFSSATFAGYGKSAARFIPATGGEFDRVETVIARAGGSPGTTVATVSIVPESPASVSPPFGSPGLIPVWAATASSGLSATASIVTFTGPRASLVAGQPYWLVVEATDSTWWYQSSPPVTGTTANKVGSPFWNTMQGLSLPAFRVSDSNPPPPPTAGACCNPATGGCTILDQAVCTGVGGLGLSFAGIGITCEAAPAGFCTSPPPPSCAADFDHSGGLGVQDIFDFLNAYFAGCP